jgi:hypothetical protein
MHMIDSSHSVHMSDSFLHMSDFGLSHEQFILSHHEHFCSEAFLFRSAHVKD